MISNLSIPWQRTLYIMLVAQFMTAVGFSSIFPFLPLYVKSLGVRSGLSVEFMAGAVFSAQAATMMIASPIWGSLADRLGRKVMVERAMFGGAFILLLMAFVRSAEELVLLRAVQGLVTGTAAAANALVAASAPRQRTGYAMGLLQIGMSSGVAVGPLVGGAVADWYGYNAAFYVTAAMLFLAGVLVWFGVREDFQPTPVEKKVKRKSMASSWRAVFASQGVMATYAMRFISQLGRMTIIPIAPLFIATLLGTSGQVNSFTGLVIGLAALMATLSALVLGPLGDRIGHRKILIACSAAAALLYLPQSLVTSGWQLLALQALSGVAMGGLIPSISALLAIYTRAGLEGAVYGLDNSINAGARSVAPLLGSSVAIWLGLRATFTATALLFLLGSLMAIFFLPKITKNSPARKENDPQEDASAGSAL